ncbi:MAG: Gfo/Idh/MocA family oxidoreductase [Firmicutes bacterium]|nr:Gfo/Idh/MocA family oxidoreductase [Bacillota bacterium]
MVVKIGAIGTGRRGKDHLRRLAQMDDVKITAVCDILPGVAQEAAAIGNSRKYLDYREMLKQEELDAVVVATPAPVHADPTVLALEQGIPVMCEKPLAWTLDDALRIVKAAEETGCICETGYQWRHNDFLQKALDRLRGSGVALVRGTWYHTIPLVESIRDVKTGGGQIFDQSTHIIDLSRYFAGDISTLYGAYTLNARTRAEFDNYENWDGYAVTVKYMSGAVGGFTGTYALFIGHGEPVVLDIVGSEILVKFLGDQLTITTPSGIETLGQETAGFTAGADIIGNFIKAVQTGDRDLIKSPPSDSIKTLAATIGANLSAQTGDLISPEELIARASAGENIAAVDLTYL